MVYLSGKGGVIYKLNINNKHLSEKGGVIYKWYINNEHLFVYVALPATKVFFDL